MRAIALFALLLLLAGCTLPRGSTNTLGPEAISTTTPQELMDYLNSTEGISVESENYYFGMLHPLYKLNKEPAFDALRFAAFPTEPDGDILGYMPDDTLVVVVRAEDIETASSLFDEINEYYSSDCGKGYLACFHPVFPARVNVGNEMGSAYRASEARFSPAHNDPNEYRDTDYVVFFRRNNMVVLLEVEGKTARDMGTSPGSNSDDYFTAAEAKGRELLDTYAIMIDEAIR